MPRILVAFHSRGGRTRRLAEAVAAGAREAGAAAELRPVAEVEPASLLEYDAFAFGSPAWYGLPAAPLKELFDRSVVLQGRLDGRIGAAFATAAHAGGGNETTCLAILQMMLVHGMLVLGAAGSDPYGPIAIGEPDEHALESGRTLGRRLAAAAQRGRG